MTQYSLVKSPILPGLIGLFLTQQFSVSLHKPNGRGQDFCGIFPILMTIVVNY